MKTIPVTRVTRFEEHSERTEHVVLQQCQDGSNWRYRCPFCKAIEFTVHEQDDISVIECWGVAHDVVTKTAEVARALRNRG